MIVGSVLGNKDRKTTPPVPEQDFIISSLPPSQTQKRLALGVVLVLLVVFCITAGPLSTLQLPPVPAFVPAYATAIFAVDSITAVLLFAQFSILRSRALLVIASGYLFTALVVIAWMLTFPGVFAPSGLLGAGPQSTSWLYILWHAGFPLFVIAYALSKDAGPPRRLWWASAGAAILSSVAVTAAVVSVATYLVTAHDPLLPRLIYTNRISTLWYFTAGSMTLLSVLALIALWLRRRSVLDLWLMVVMCAYAVEISFPRFSLGWYAGRVFGLLSGSLVLFVLLYEITLLYRRRAEDRLRERARLLDLTHDSVFVRDTSDVITYWNRGAEELYGWSRERVVGKTTHQLLQTSFPEPLAEINAELLRTGRWEGELVHTKRDGTQVVVASRWSLQRDEQGRPVAILETNNDVTERKRTEEALREREGRIRRLVESNVIGVHFWELSGGLTEANDAFLRTVGYSRQDLLSGNVDWASMTPPEYRAADARAIEELAQTGTFRPYEKEYVRKDGERVAVLVAGAAFEGSSEQGVSFILDLTERKAAEAERERLGQRLRQAEKMEAIGRLAGGIAHDFNNILGAILGYGEMTQKALGEGNGVRRYVDQVMQAGARGKGLVERILAFSRSGLGERVPVHVQSVIEEALQILAASLLPQVRLEKRLDVGDTAMVGDATQLHQVAMNLCTNALQAMEHGGVLTVVLDRESVTERRLLSHGTLLPGPYVHLSVSDTGSGIPPAVLERMFDPFFTTKGIGDGTGLGLSLVHGIVADFGGAIDVTTQAGAGTTFTVWLPAAGETPRLLAEPVGELPQGNGETVMIVDDQRSLVALAEETLAVLGYEPAGFDSSVAALQAFRAEPQRYDLVLTDETMPDLSGVELAREIRRLRPDLPIVLMSGYSGAQLTGRARAIGVAEVLRKPLVRRDIAEALGRALRTNMAAATK